MKLAFTSTGTNLASKLDPSFGRAKNFLIYDIQTQTLEVISNQQNLAATQGAGIQAAQTIVATGAEALITGHCGPKALRVLADARIKVFNTQEPIVIQALKRYLAGELISTDAAETESHSR